VLRATDRESEDTESALAVLCEAYWYPLYAFVRRRGHDAAQAEDLTQSFFAFLLDHKTLAMADQSRGRFRSFLLTSLDNFLKNQWRSQQAIKRGGGTNILSLDFETAEKRYQYEPFHEMTPERVYQRNWALAVLAKVLDNVRQQYFDSGKEHLFEAINGYITGGTNLPYGEIAAQLNMKEGAIKVAVHRLRERYGQQLRLQIAKTVESPADVDDELRSLLEAIAVR
jgi:RNA polymerase sigma-70 factor (ECF subfamily)